jgi:hypothetical protein
VITLTPLGSLRIAWRKFSVALTVLTSSVLTRWAVGTPDSEVKSVAAIFDFNDLHNPEQNSLAMTPRDVEWFRKIAMHASRTRYARKSYFSICGIGTSNIPSSRRRPCDESRSIHLSLPMIEKTDTNVYQNSTARETKNRKCHTSLASSITSLKSTHDAPPDLETIYFFVCRSE